MTITSDTGNRAVKAVPPPFDPELTAAISAYRGRAGSGMTPPTTDEELRLGGAFEITERLAPGQHGAPDVPLLVCRPRAATACAPTVYYIHGGGMISGDNRLGLRELLPWAEELGTVVVSVEYRLAPAAPHPGPVEDCYAGLAWTAANAAELGIDKERIIVVGRSAGGGLAAAATLLSRDRGGPTLAGQLLLCPMLDDRNDTPSARQMEGLGVWDRAANEAGWTALLGPARGGPDVSQYAAPARATDLSGLPPTYIDVGSAETFRDEAVTYASRIWLAGGVAELHVWPGGSHGIVGLVPQAALSRAAVEAERNWLRRLLSPTTTACPNDLG